MTEICFCKNLSKVLSFMAAAALNSTFGCRRSSSIRCACPVAVCKGLLKGGSIAATALRNDEYLRGRTAACGISSPTSHGDRPQTDRAGAIIVCPRATSPLSQSFDVSYAWCCQRSQPHSKNFGRVEFPDRLKAPVSGDVLNALDGVVWPNLASRMELSQSKIPQHRKCYYNEKKKPLLLRVLLLAFVCQHKSSRAYNQDLIVVIILHWRGGPDTMCK